ncbi:hypothetical protein HYQ46_009260 [Verticillium longisporum]|nr:hypothetical protein HYQ46_009260 [Verticillium longisporum]
MEVIRATDPHIVQNQRDSLASDLPKSSQGRSRGGPSNLTKKRRRLGRAHALSPASGSLTFPPSDPDFLPGQAASGVKAFLTELRRELTSLQPADRTSSPQARLGRPKGGKAQPAGNPS